MAMLRYVYNYGYGAAVRWRNVVTAVFVLSAGGAIAETKVVIGFGDSLTQGYGLTADLGFVPQMERWLLDQGGDVRVINAGVSGDTTAGAKARIDWTLAEDADAIIVAFGGNDVLRGLSPEAAKTNLDYVLNAAVAKGLNVLLVGMQAPLNYGPDYKRAFDAMYPELAAKYDVPLYPSFFAAFGGEGDVPAELTEFIQADGLHPSAKGVARIVADMGPSVLALIE